MNDTVLTKSPGLSEGQKRIISQTKKTNRARLKEAGVKKYTRKKVAPIDECETPMLGPEDLLPEPITN